MILLRILLVINALFLGGIGLVMSVSPTYFFNSVEGISEGGIVAQSLGRAFGLASLGVAVMSLLMSTRTLNDDLRFVGFGGLMAFHLGLTIAQILNVIEGLATILMVGIHAGFTLLFLILFLWVALKEKS